MNSDDQSREGEEVQLQENNEYECMQNKEDKRNEELKEKMQLRRKQQIEFIMTQTNYNEFEASEKLESCNNDVMKVVTEYLGITPKKNENVKKTKNQKIYSVIRNIMDSGSRNFIIQQERAKKIEEIKKYMESKNNQNKNETTTKNTNDNFIKEKMD